MEGHDQPAAFCPYYHRAVELIGRRWSGVILRALLTGVCRFSDLTAAIPGLSDRLLSERLKEFEAEGGAKRSHSPQSAGFFSKVKEFWDDLTER